jgi:DNA polymerase type B, organellar and viral.
MLLSEVYADTYEVTGNLRAYIGKAAVGGRVHCNSKYIKQQVHGNIDDLDATSLYPSAIKELSETRGLPYGKAKRLTEFKDWPRYNHCIMTVNVLTVGKVQQIPMLYNRGETSIDWTNTPPPDAVIMDCMTLRNLIEFHQITYEIIDGIYWENHEYDNKFGILVGELFQTRLKYKKEKPALANVVKLLLNSLYGKTLLRPSHSTNVIVKKQTFKQDEHGGWVVNNPENHHKYITEHFKASYHGENSMTIFISLNKVVLIQVITAHTSDASFYHNPSIL